jgi:hypothetical protein
MELNTNTNGHDPAADDARDVMFLMGGVALMIFGAGLVLSNPAIRRLLGQANVGSFMTAAIPDVERYKKLRSM